MSLFPLETSFALTEAKFQSFSLIKHVEKLLKLSQKVGENMMPLRDRRGKYPRMTLIIEFNDPSVKYQPLSPIPVHVQ